MAKDATERRIYVLPSELLERLRAYQTSQGIGSEVEAVRRLLNEALQMRDSAASILKQLSAKWAEDRDLRVLARDVLANHALVKSIQIGNTELEFTLRDGQTGSISIMGSLKAGQEDDHGFRNLRAWSPEINKQNKPRFKQSGWDAPKVDDDDIPF